MSTVEEIQAAIAKLSPPEFDEVARWTEAQLEAAWDRQMKADVDSGELDRLWAQAEREIAAGETTPLDGGGCRP